jgi:hypothetical protein
MSGQWPDTGFQLADGRKITVESMLWEQTYITVWEGRPDAQTDERVKTSALRRAATHFSSGAVVLHEDSAFHAAHSRLPNVTLTSHLTSAPTDGNHDMSALTVVCFIEHDPDKPVLALLAEALGNLDWERHAVNCDL